MRCSSLLITINSYTNQKDPIMTQYLQAKALECEQFRLNNQKRVEQIIRDIKQAIEDKAAAQCHSLYNEISLLCNKNIESLAQQFFYEKRFITKDEAKNRKKIFFHAAKVIKQELDNIKQAIKISFR